MAHHPHHTRLLYTLLCLSSLALLQACALADASREEAPTPDQGSTADAADPIDGDTAAPDTSSPDMPTDIVDDWSEPDITEDPDVSEDPDISDEPDITEDPDISDEPDTMDEPDVSDEPDVVEDMTPQDLCEGVVCEPPASICEGDDLITYTAGVCQPQTGQCSEPERGVVDCTATDQVCRQGQCVDLCGDTTCQAPEPECDGDLLVTYTAGACIPAEGACSAPVAATTDCMDDARVCRRGQCVDLCANTTCDAPEAQCEGDTLTTWSAGSCDPSDGQCTAPVPTETHCAEQGMTCAQGQCVAACPDGMVYVPAGEFIRGTTAWNQPDEQPVRNIYLSAFCMDATEVTTSAYTSCFSSGFCDAASMEDGCNFGAQGKGQHPINCVNWSQATTFCTWRGGRLPTEAEWEKAARGTDGRTYPWGEGGESCDYAVMDDGGEGCGQGGTWPVGSKPAGVSPYGAYDMAGNVWEWVSDWLDDDYYTDAPTRDPTGPVESTGVKGHRGSAWPSRSVRANNRSGSNPLTSHDDLGFRCVSRPLPQ